MVEIPENTPQPLTLRGIRNVMKAGVWHNYASKDDKLDLKKKTLIYGFNGTGKTTLSRIFSSLAFEQLDPNLPRDCSFEIELSDGTLITSNEIRNAFGKNLLVFNSDFVNRNIVWADGHANPIFYISKENAEAANNYNNAEQNLKTLQNEKDMAAKNAKQAVDSFAQFKTDTARRVRDIHGVMLTQTYNATHLASDFSKFNFAQDTALSDDDIEQLQRSVLRSEPLPKILTTLAIDTELQSLISKIQTKLVETPGSQFSGLLASHAAMHGWVHEGLGYHTKEHLNECLFCGNGLSGERLQELAAVFDTGWVSFQTEITILTEKTGKTLESLRSLYRDLPKSAEILETQRKEYVGVSTDLANAIKVAVNAMHSSHALLKEKQEKLNQSLDITDQVRNFMSSDWGIKAKALIDTISNIFIKHNKSFDDHQKEQNEAAYKLKSHVLNAEKGRFGELEKASKDSDAALAGLDTKLTKAKKVRDECANLVHEQGVALNDLNALLRDYLGHEDVRLRTKKEGYELVRPNGVSARNLSEGEKTAIAFCFFLTLLKADDRRKKELVVIIDDPISSLDSSCMTHVFALIKRHTKDCAQTIVSTHNITFMQMVKRLFENKYGGTTVPNFKLLYLLCSCPAGKFENRQTTLVQMPELISKYDSEYHYLFALTYKAAKSGTCPELILLPNATRKMLEIFLAFAAPGQGDFATALGEISKITGITREEISSLERLTQIESHGSLAAASSFSPLTMEEATQAASAAIRYIKSSHNAHFEKMEKLVS